MVASPSHSSHSALHQPAEYGASVANVDSNWANANVPTAMIAIAIIIRLTVTRGHGVLIADLSDLRLAWDGDRQSVSKGCHVLRRHPSKPHAVILADQYSGR